MVKLPKLRTVTNYGVVEECEHYLHTREQKVSKFKQANPSAIYSTFYTRYSLTMLATNTIIII